MTRKRFHGLKKARIRATWNKYNLYNLSRFREPRLGTLTYYQQKWSSKSITRAYHGEHVREGYWERLFRPRLSAVVPMDPAYLAEHDGSEQGAGRGSGKDMPRIGKKERRSQLIPYMHMTYAPLERRLDMAVWRALFASSARQAKQFCTHGLVRVNGQLMRHPGYLLNPGDMFQVEPDSVMFATGAKKEEQQRKLKDSIQEKRHKVWKLLGNKLKMKPPAAIKPKEEAKEEAEEDQPETAVGLVRVSKSPRTLEMTRAERKLSLDTLLLDAQTHLNYGKKFLGAKRKQHLRKLMQDIKLTRSNINRTSDAELQEEIDALVKRSLAIRRIGRHEKEDDSPERPESKAVDKRVTKRYLEVQGGKMGGEENPVDPEKPYATPWKPRPYMSAFAFIPRYLEVNHRICSAVYLRHPVARPGLAEVPSPFSSDVQQLAFNWYLRRR